MGDETDRRKEEEDDERVNWGWPRRWRRSSKRKQETAETIEQEPEGAAGGGAREEARAGQRQRRVGPGGVKGGVQGERNEDCTERECTRGRVGGVAPWTFL